MLDLRKATSYQTGLIIAGANPCAKLPTVREASCREVEISLDLRRAAGLVDLDLNGRIGFPTPTLANGGLTV